MQGLTMEPTVGEGDGATVGAGLELPTGCAPPPAQAPGGVHGAHVPEVPAQRMLPGVVDA